MKMRNFFPMLTMLLFASLAGCDEDDSPDVTKDVTSPVTNTTDPAENSNGTARNTEINITFNEAMDPSTINSSTFIVKQGTTEVFGTVTYSGTTATFTPTNTLEPGLTYTATLTTGAKDMAGNSLATKKEWSFATAGSTVPRSVVDLGASANYVILAKTAINNNSTSAITGDLGLSPAATSYATGFALTNATGYATST